MTEYQRLIARHMLGLDNPDSKGRSYRNRYVCGTRHPKFGTLMRMTRDGFASRERFGAHPENRWMFVLTPSGAQAAIEPGESLDPEDFPIMEGDR